VGGEKQRTGRSIVWGIVEGGKKNMQKKKRTTGGGETGGGVREKKKGVFGTHRQEEKTPRGLLKKEFSQTESKQAKTETISEETAGGCICGETCKARRWVVGKGGPFDFKSRRGKSQADRRKKAYHV